MSREQVETAILGLSPQERPSLLVWLDERRMDLFGSDDADGEPSPGLKAELLRRRQEYTDNPGQFQRMDGPAIEVMFSRIRRHVAARLSSY